MGGYMLKRIAIVFTGGTISMKVDPRIAAAIPALSSEEIMSMVTNIDKIADIETITFSRLPGPQMTPEKLIELRTVILDLLERHDIHGVVITHGTDSLEETAYYLDLSIDSNKPIVMVAAMRNGSELGYDGPSNLSSAICTAVSDEALGKGVLIVLNNEVNAASEATKTHTMSLDTFKSMEFGPLGIVDQDEVIFYRNFIKKRTILTDGLETKVHLIKSAIGMDSLMMDYLLTQNAKGFVIEAMGRGNIPPAMVSGIERAIASNIPVVMVSRCPMGRILDSYGYDGGGKQLRNIGVIFASNLNGQKARIKLMLALHKTNDLTQIKDFFESNGHVI
jgi:L-asparaginase